jgi:hypothetical protein
MGRTKGNRKNDMSSEAYIDATNDPSLARVAKEVHDTRTRRVIRIGNEEVALLSPVASQRPARRRARTTSADDPLWNIIGIADADPPKDGATDVSSNKHQYLAEAYYPKKP